MNHSNPIDAFAESLESTIANLEALVDFFRERRKVDPRKISWAEAGGMSACLKRTQEMKEFIGIE